MPVSPKMENFAKKVVILWVIPEVIPEFFCLVEGVTGHCLCACIVSVISEKK